MDLSKRLDPPLWGDLFAGFGGASAGIEAVIGRPVDFAINHWATAIKVHARNHPGTQHFNANLWEVRPRDVAQGRKVYGLWFSPDCTHFSVARGGKPRKQEIRALAEIVPEWLRELRPSIWFLENVREFETWGPLDEHGDPIKERSGEFFKKWLWEIRTLGYSVDWQVLDSSQFGAPTRRKRLFMIGRCDGRPIVWPAATHGPGLKPFHTAAECIDWSIECPSLFLSPEEAKRLGVRRPLAEKTLWRIAQGMRRFVFENPRPFVLKVNHGRKEARHKDVDEPLSTVTAKRRGHGIVTPVIARYNGDRVGQEPGEPITTIDASNRFGLIEPHLSEVPPKSGSSTPGAAGEVRSGRQSGEPEAPAAPGLVAPMLVNTRNGERHGRHGEQRARVFDAREPLRTVTAQGSQGALVAAFLSKHFGDPRRSDGGGGVVVGSELDAPLGTVTQRDHHSVVTGNLVKLYGDCHGSGLDEPMPTVTASGMHVAEVRAFLTAYYGEDGTNGQLLTEPMRTLTARARLGLVLVHGVWHQVTDIGFRMLKPHELMRAQFGRFAAGYDLSDAETQEEQVALIGNSVPPEVVEAIVAANVEPAMRRAA